MPDKFIVKKDFNGNRFDKWFKDQIINLPNSLIQKLLRTNNIKVNKKKIKSSFRLKTGDEVTIFNLKKYKPTNFKAKITYLPSNEEKNEFEDLIIQNNDDYVVINKPRNIAVQSGTNNLKNVVDTLKKTKYFENSKPYIVHRLDKETTGVFLIAKNRSSAQYFTSLFRLRKIHKTYLAIVKGEIPLKLKKMEDILEYYDKNKKTKLKAITHIKILKRKNNFSLLELNPITGRKHQLRKQLFNRGYPIIGDQKYYIDKNNKNKNSQMFLHSYKIKFIRNDQKFTFTAEYDENFKKKIDLYFR